MSVSRAPLRQPYLNLGASLGITLGNYTIMSMEQHSFIEQNFTFSNVFTTVLIYLVFSILISFWRAPRYPTSIPWVGHGKGWRAAFKNIFGAFTNSQKWVNEGYRRYSKNGQPFVLPSTLGSPAEIVIPRSQMQWMLDLPDTVLSTSAAHYDLLAGQYGFVEPIILQDPYHEHVIHRNLARNLNSLIPDLSDEICRNVDELFGMQHEWRSFNLLDFFMKLILKTTNHMLVGEPLCQNQDYLDNILGFTNDVIRGFLLFPLTPKALHPLIGAIHSLGPKYHAWRTARHSLPLIRKRLEDIKKKDAGEPKYKDWEETNDFITWSIRTAMAEGRSDEYEPRRIALRIMPVNFASIHTTSMTGHAALLDMLSSDPDVLEQLREEAQRVYREEGNQWTKQGLARMYKMDSAIRESQRYSVIAMTFVQRKVVDKAGVTGPDGTHFAYGTLLACPWASMSADEDLHEQPDNYDAFRYSRKREAYEAKPVEERDQAETLRLKQSALVTTSDKYLPFGHGRHAW